jgi:hypothetical protein
MAPHNNNPHNNPRNNNPTQQSYTNPTQQSHTTIPQQSHTTIPHNNPTQQSHTTIPHNNHTTIRTTIPQHNPTQQSTPTKNMIAQVFWVNLLSSNTKTLVQFISLIGSLGSRTSAHIIKVQKWAIKKIHWPIFELR